MDTKSRNIRFSFVFKLFSVLLALLGIVLVVGAFKTADYASYLFKSDDYIDSYEAKAIVSTLSGNLNMLPESWESKAKVEAGEYLTEDDLKLAKNQIESARNEAQSSLGMDMRNKYPFLISADYDYYKSYDSKELDYELVQRAVKEWSLKLEEIDKQYDTSAPSVREKAIKNQLEAFRSYQSFLKTIEKKQWKYYFEQNGKVYSNVSEDFFPTGKGVEITWPEYGDDFSKFSVAKVGISREKFEAEEKEYLAKRENAKKFGAQALAGAALILLGLIWTLYTAGSRVGTDEVKMMAIDRIWPDLLLGIDVGLYVIAEIVGHEIVWSWNQNHNSLSLYAMITVLFILYLFTAQFFGVISKRIKRRELIKSTLTFQLLYLVFRILSGIWRFFKGRIAKLNDFIKSGAIKSRLIMTLGLYSAVNLFLITLFIISPQAGFTFGMIFSFVCWVGLHIGIFFFLVGRLQSLKTLAQGVKIIKSGDLSYNIPPLQEKEINDIAVDVNSITEGLKVAVENELKSERMKIELVTNVSHDIKTPLTSVINYSDLLSKEDLSEPAAGYIKILKAKSERLKNLIEDLFLVSKAQSGAIEINLEPLCLNDILHQAFAEYSEKFEEVGLTVRERASSPKIMVTGDGSRMWRVLSNALSNAAKYSQSGTRLYVELFTAGSNGFIVFKNISNYEMDFQSTEIVERFKRGDEARSSEGSGLGLSIAQSFMRLQGGELTVATDGDLFKLSLSLPLAEAFES